MTKKPFLPERASAWLVTVWLVLGLVVPMVLAGLGLHFYVEEGAPAPATFMLSALLWSFFLQLYPVVAVFGTWCLANLLYGDEQ